MRHFREGIQVGIPIGLGYFAVAFSLGIVAAKAGITPFEGFMTSLLVNASAGESAGFTAILEKVPYLQMTMITLVTNARYILMSFALSQKIDPKENMIHRLLLGFFLTDEYFALAISKDGYCDPYYSYGAILVAAPLWALGTAMGIFFGNVLPMRIVSGLSVALYGMFLAIIMPPCKTNRNIAVLIAVSALCSFLLNRFTSLSGSMITILLTILISLAGAIFFPRKGESDES